jgi:hypothetical protein
MTRYWLAAALAAGFVCPVDLVGATDFRIETDVFVADGNEAVSHNLTLFRAGLVYDYLTVPRSTTIFDPRVGRFLLLDPANRLQTEVPTREVESFNEELRARAAAHKDPLLQFMAHPRFSTRRPEENVLLLTSPNLSYRLEVEPARDAAALRQYLEFSDWYARLNTLVNAGSPPPYTRIAMNKALAQVSAIPTGVELTIKPSANGAAEMTMRSRHRVGWKLLGEDLRRIDETGKQLATFKKVGLEDFLSAGAQQPAANLAEKPEPTRRRG